MLPLVSLVAVGVPPALAWRVLRHRHRTWSRLVLAAALAAAALFAGWRATTAVSEGPVPVAVAALAVVAAAMVLRRAGVRRSA